MAEWTGLEPAAFRVTGGRYNQLNYHSVVRTIVNVKINVEPVEIQQLNSFCLHLMHKTTRLMALSLPLSHGLRIINKNLKGVP